MCTEIIYNVIILGGNRCNLEINVTVWRCKNVGILNWSENTVMKAHHISIIMTTVNSDLCLTSRLTWPKIQFTREILV
jgi:hypothetical protein